MSFTPIPKGTAYITEYTVALGNIGYQQLYVGVRDPSGNPIGTTSISLTLGNLCQVLDTAKATLTKNSLLYIFVPSNGGQMVAISGLGNRTMQTEALILNGSPRPIQNYSYEQYPLLNISAATIYQYSGFNFSADIADSNWQVGDYMFQLKVTTIFNFKYYVVTAAPIYDFLGDTIYLKQKLQDDGVKSTLTVILS
ncbi:hypothetical protein HDU93_008636, partial [Gonapodya sp. JEL0774]